MFDTFETIPAYSTHPGTMVTGDGVVFSSSFRSCHDCGVILYHLPELSTTRVAFDESCRCGSLYSLLVKGLNPSEWAYRYYRDDVSFEDPCAREIMTVDRDGRALILGRLYDERETAPHNNGGGHLRRSWADQILCCMHIRGFTASPSSGVPAGMRGTFLGAAEKIPCLKRLGVTGIELLPVYELLPAREGQAVGEPRDITPEARERALQVTRALEERARTPATYVADAGNEGGVSCSMPACEDILEHPEKPNYWGFGPGCYYAPKKAYAGTGRPQWELRRMVELFHQNDMQVFLQLYFPDNIPEQTQVDIARFYVTHYQIDGFHLKGNGSALRALACDPMLGDTALYYHSFPYEEIKSMADTTAAAGSFSPMQLCEYRDDFQTMARRFVKSDGGVLKDFLRLFLDVSPEHGSVHYITNYEGFTLMDLVSYNGKHNEANGEENRDGTGENWSWNCGAEGPTRKRSVRGLRQRQMYNLIALNYLAQGTPLLLAGDEHCNSQGGNNNAYCQDNETGWNSWKETADGRAVRSFTEKMASFRKEHAVFRRRTPFCYADPRATGYPDLSLHGREAWKADLSEASRSVGILFSETYAEENASDSILYVAMNMHWDSQELALPKPPRGTQWRVVMDTCRRDPFCEEPVPVPDPHTVHISGRSIQILKNFPVARRESGIPSPVAVIGIRESGENS